jgi:hypothetical protein
MLAVAPWAVVLAGVLVMTVLLVLATGYLSADRRSSGAPEPVWPFAPGNTPSPPITTGSETPDAPPVAGVRSPVPTSRSTAASRKPSRPVPSRTTASTARPATVVPPPPAPPQAELTARFRVLADYRDSFIGEVLIRNRSGTSGSWTVELRFRDEVDQLRNFWVEGAPRPELRRSGDRYVFTGVGALSGGASAPLRFHFDRRGDRETPLSCTVNGRGCDIY